MKAIYWTIAAAALSFVEPAQAGITDPEVIIYRFPGMRDDGGGSLTGIATVFHCTNFSGAPETVRFVTRNFNSTLVNNQTIPLDHLATKTVVSHLSAAYEQDLNLITGPVNQGTTAIAATSINVICTAMTIDAAAHTPIGVALRGIRFSPVPGSQE